MVGTDLDVVLKHDYSHEFSKGMVSICVLDYEGNRCEGSSVNQGLCRLCGGLVRLIMVGTNDRHEFKRNSKHE